MSGIDREVKEAVLQWVQYADADLRMARHAIGMGEQCPPHLVAYHCQQSAEKYLKGYLVLRGVDYPYTHNIAWLRELCEREGAPADEFRDADALTPYAITTRYPHLDQPVSLAEAQRAVDIASEVRSRMRALLAQAGLTDLA